MVSVEPVRVVICTVGLFASWCDKSSSEEERSVADKESREAWRDSGTVVVLRSWTSLGKRSPRPGSCGDPISSDEEIASVGAPGPASMASTFIVSPSGGLLLTDVTTSIFSVPVSSSEFPYV